jgi:Zn-dependent protease
LTAEVADAIFTTCSFHETERRNGMRKVLISVAMGLGSWCLLAWTFNPLFASVLMIGLTIHESGHLIAMLRNGISIKGLYFLPFVGAVIVPNERLKDRWTGVKVTLAGPAMGGCSALLALAAWIVWRDPTIAAAAFFFSVINAFNMIPVFPLDGGQALAYALDVGKKPHQAVYRRMWGLYIICIGLLFALLGNWVMSALVAYIGYGGIKGFLTELARREDRERVRADLAKTFDTKPELVAEAVEAPLIQLLRDENPVFPEKLLEQNHDLAGINTLNQIEWCVREDAESPPSENEAFSETGAELAELEAELTDSEARFMNQRLKSHLQRNLRLTYVLAIRWGGAAACGKYHLEPFQPGMGVTDESSFDPRQLSEDGGSVIRGYLAGTEPAPISAPLALRGRLMYSALALGLGGLTILTGILAGWSFKALH